MFLSWLTFILCFQCSIFLGWEQLYLGGGSQGAGGVLVVDRSLGIWYYFAANGGKEIENLYQVRLASLPALSKEGFLS
ncbi:MAG: hypothetical protein A3F54_01100 [Candidatus Kerfeldbacteria bacterium RIFCSPHIGHO2_12_FULL_48_17]|uniref:Uncharacterized protein n=1 Tax=Candidatus Kerfeldbacteria bacterium RIFCSPHIGHO2_12_FULL_48_17 TaxID=1798542 RepID=A0A1G2AY73_9BACT|nr:MAG: hypothetical protein A3F54_01100 [Candidatus Kerfeldbacteria bacterium RIFCSPHIGHO2_12_FULL_48_17]